MRPTDQWIHKLSEEGKALVEFLVNQFNAWHPNLTPALKYGLYFLVAKKNICYFNPKKDGIDIGFMYARFFPSKNLMITENRKQVASIFIRFDEDVDIDFLQKIFEEAMQVDAQWH